MRPAPVLDARRAAEIAAEIVARAAAHAPGWRPGADGPGAAIAAILAGHAETLAAAVNRGPDKRLLAFLDMLGLELLPPQAARAPVVLQAVPGARGGRAPAGTRCRGRAEGDRDGEPPLFETERAIALVGAPLAEVVSVDPGSDAYADHTADALGGRPFRLFEGLRPVPHEIYLAHDLHLALTGRAAVEVDLDLAQASGEPLEVEWSWWDGEAWRAFSEFGAAAGGGSFDGTGGLTRSGTLRLVAECAAAEPTIVAGRSGFWVRGRARGGLAPRTGLRPPLVDRVGLRTVVARPLPADCASGLLPEAAIGGGQRLDLTKTFWPLGQRPGPDAALYLASDEAFGRPGARVSVCVRRATTPQDEADRLVKDYEVTVQRAEQHVGGIRDAAAALREALRALVDANTGLLRAPPAELFEPATAPEDWYAGVRAAVNAALAGARAAAGPAQALTVVLGAQAAGAVAAFANPLTIPGFATVTAITTPALLAFAAQVVYGIATAARNLVAVTPATQPLIDNVEALKTALDAWQLQLDALAAGDLGAALNLAGQAPALTTAWMRVANDLDDWPATGFLPAGLPAFVGDARARYADIAGRINGARAAIEAAIASAGDLIGALEDLSPITAAAAAGVLPPFLPPPELAWEYHDGTRWRPLAPHAPGETARNLMADGTVDFTVPDDWAPVEVQGAEARWLRVRLAAGSFERVRIVTWFDTQSSTTNLQPVLDARPPALAALALGYEHASPTAAPERCLTHNDFRWADLGERAARRGDPFPPFTPVEDPTPGLYLGFDGPLPADVVGLFLDVEEREREGPRLVWEGWDGTGWRGLAVDDETSGLARPGVVAVTWAGAPEPEGVRLAAAAGTRLEPVEPRDAVRLVPGDEVWVSAGSRGEPGTVAAVGDGVVLMAAPLAGSYPGGEVRRASLARFGTPRTWLRARRGAPGGPPEATVRGIHVNAAWAAAAETRTDELIGASDGRPGQVAFLRSGPVLGEPVVEVLELRGGRAEAELPLLERELAGRGAPADALRVVRDPATGRVREAWVAWERRPHLLFSGPDDRHYVLERTRGRVEFGDGRRGRIPPAGPDGLRARRYAVGGGRRGNLPAGAIREVVSGVVAVGIANPRPADGGADAEEAGAVRDRGPLMLRHRRQALSAADYEALALEASPSVAAARALPTTHPSGRTEPGWVTVLVVPRSPDPRPVPSLELRARVEAFMRERAPAGARVAVRGAAYQPVGVEVAVAARPGADPGAVRAAVEERCRRLLHPLTGGPEGRGWAFGRDVMASDVAAVIAAVDGVDGAEGLALTVGGVPQGTRAAVPPTRIVVPGTLAVSLAGAGT